MSEFDLEDIDQCIERVQALHDLLEFDVGWLWADEEEVWDGKSKNCYPVFCLNMNDTFGFATADAEPVPFANLIEVRDLYRKYGNHGLVAWVAKQRDKMPIHCSCHHDDDPQFLAACKELGWELKNVQRSQPDQQKINP